MDKDYKALLCKFAGNVDVYKLIELCKLDDFRVMENYYQVNKKYPDKRDCLGKLLIDLKTTKAKLLTSKGGK